MREYRNEYRNAHEVLPEELVKKLQRIYTGPVWIPAVRKRRIKSEARKRDEDIMRLYRDGKSIKEIAETVPLCLERIRQIIRRYDDGR
jgi:DNA-binding NarL/FixJ family response regulator